MTLAGRLRAALGHPARDGLLGGDLEAAGSHEAREAAVLIAVTDRPEPGVILTVRHESMRTHAGQIAFPGGRIDPGEQTTDAALREASEELGLDTAVVDVVGAMDQYRTVTGFLVTPVVGVIPPDVPLIPHDAEVADWFEAPLDFLLDPANQVRRQTVFAGRERHYYEIAWEGRRIWGATAAMLVNLSRLLQWR